MNGYKKNKPYFVAEISANHCGNFQLAKKIIKCAKINGADAVKLQTFTADTITMKSNRKEFFITDKKDIIIKIFINILETES